MQKTNLITISNTDKQYPRRLNSLHKPPKSLHIKGADINELLKMPVVAVVGSRKATGYGRRVTQDIVGKLVEKGVLIISGLALGVDSIAHEETVKSDGKTIAVLPGGVENIYPKRHVQLAEEIISSGGALLSEYPGKHAPMKHNFIERNRIIAALCDVLVVTEAGEKSGSLHTARFALENGRTVAAVPGDIYSPTSAGCNNLIKTGAQPITGAEDVIELLNFQGRQLSFDGEYYPENEAERAILTLLKRGFGHGDRLRSMTELSDDDFDSVLHELETKGVIMACGNDRWRIKHD